jgi:hypothetical protein
VTRICEIGTKKASTKKPRTQQINNKIQLMLFLVHRFLSPWWRRRYVPPKRWFLQEPHGITSQKTTFFIVTAVKTSYLTYCLPMYAVRAYVKGHISISAISIINCPTTPILSSINYIEV